MVVKNTRSLPRKKHVVASRRRIVVMLSNEIRIEALEMQMSRPLKNVDNDVATVRNDAQNGQKLLMSRVLVEVVEVPMGELMVRSQKEGTLQTTTKTMMTTSMVVR